MLLGGKKKREVFDDLWMEIGRKSFARFFCLPLEDVKTMEKNNNGVFMVMMDEMSTSLNDFDNYMVKIRYYDDINEEMPREELLDI